MCGRRAAPGGESVRSARGAPCLPENARALRPASRAPDGCTRGERVSACAPVGAAGDERDNPCAPGRYASDDRDIACASNL